MENKDLNFVDKTINAYINYIINCFNFSEKSTRFDFLIVNIFNIGLYITLFIIFSIGFFQTNYMLALSLFLTCAYFTLIVRRLNDIKKSKFLSIFYFIPIINIVFIIYISFAKSK